MTHIPHSRIHVPVITISLGAAAAKAGHAVARFARGVGHTFVTLPGVLTSLFAMAYVDPYVLPKRKDDWSNPENF